MLLKSINPATGFPINSFEEIHTDDIDRILENSTNEFRKWKRQSVKYRVAKLQHLAGILQSKKEGLAFLTSTEMGKPISQSRAEIEKCILLCDYYMQNSEAFLTSKNVETEALESYIAYQPLGSILGIMPWNFPYWQVFRFAIPSIVAGNTVVVKHASNVPGCSIAIEQLFIEAGFPKGVYQNLLVTNKRMERIITDKRIMGVAITGSTPAGKEVAKLAASKLKKTVMELGGSDPYIILKDADIESAVNACIRGRLINTGQSCIAAKRFIIEKNIYDEVEALFVEKMRSAKMGDPFDENIQLGPLARMNLREDLHMQVTKSTSKGASLLCGGIIPETPGYFYPATVLGNITHEMPAFHEELFGPVASLIKVSDETEAIVVANHTTFGLGAAIFTSDIEKGKYIAEHELEAGCCFVNDFVHSDPRLPFGGIKDSGYGRELSELGLREFVNIKSVWIK